MFVDRNWKDYECLDTGGGEKLERWGQVILRRPDPQVIWPLSEETPLWKNADARYHRSGAGGGQWEIKKEIPERWKIQYGSLSFYIKPTGFKHTGIFPEQAVNWAWIGGKIKAAGRPVKVLNLFAYTGGATLASAAAGAEVCHVDAAKGMVSWAKENLLLSGLGERKVRFMTDDVFKFVQKELRRGSRYDAIIMDPPAYGRGPAGEMWKLESDLYPFIQSCAAILSDNPLFILVNSYTSGLSPTVLGNLLTLTLKNKFSGTVTCGEIGIPVTSSGLVLPAGILGRWEA